MKPTELTPEAAELIARRFRALADPTRLRIVNLLRTEEGALVGENAVRVGGSQGNISKGLAPVPAGGLVGRRR